MATEALPDYATHGAFQPADEGWTGSKPPVDVHGAILVFALAIVLKETV